MSAVARTPHIVDAITAVCTKAKLPLDGSIFNDAVQATVHAFSNAEYKGGDAISGYGESYYGCARALVNIKSGEFHVSLNIEAL